MMKKFTVTFLLWLALIYEVSLPVAVARDHLTPEAATKAFYSWYIRTSSELKYPLLDGQIFTYVEKRTVDRLRSDFRRGELPGDGDYFTKVQDYDEKDWMENIAVHPAIMLEGVVVVPVTFGSSDKVSVLVFLRKQDNNWKIMKVEDTQDYF